MRTGTSAFAGNADACHFCNNSAASLFSLKIVGVRNTPNLSRKMGVVSLVQRSKTQSPERVFMCAWTHGVYCSVSAQNTHTRVK